MKKEANSKYLVIDTNVLISGLIFTNSKPRLALEKALREYVVCVSEQTLNEFLEVSQRPKFSKYLTPDDIAFFTQHLCNYVKVVEITETITDCLDPKDNKFLEVAISANARFLVTGDKKDLLSMNPYRNVEIISVTEFLDEY